MQAAFDADGTLLLRIQRDDAAYTRVATACGVALLESEQKRGQPHNAGQFGPGGGGGSVPTGLSKKPKLTSTDRAAIQDYTAHHFKEINDYLRNDGSGNATTDRRIKQLDQALDKLPDHAGATHRTMDFDSKEESEKFASQFIVGGESTDKSYQSSSGRPSLIAGSVNISVEGGGGKDISSISANPNEKEVIYPRNTKYKVVSKEKDEYGRHFIKLQAVGSNEPPAAKPIMLTEEAEDGAPAVDPASGGSSGSGGTPVSVDV
jgi:hypothetical protein